MPGIRFLLSLTLLVSSYWILNTHWGTLPPVMKILDPFNGLWVNGDKKDKQQEQQLEGLIAPVTVHYGEHLVPHISAKNESDLYFAQGYVTAKDRLWQLEIQSRVVEGTLSEVFGLRTIDSDRFFIRSGLKEAALKSYDLMQSDPLTKQAIDSYALGINSYIAKLGYRDYPPEYKIFNIKPRKWQALYSAYLLKMMDYTLTGKSSDVKVSRNLTHYPFEKLQEIFPLHPLYPTSFELTNKEIVGKPEKELFKPETFSLQDLGEYIEPDKGNGSNNWAVSGKKSTTGFPIVANDTHLTYRLPNLWYEIQLVSPNQNVYGVSIPGAPGITLGFNKSLAWAVTNATMDTFDWYQVNSDSSPQYYEIKVRDQKTLKESYFKSPFGNIVYQNNEKIFTDSLIRGFALKWQATEPSNELGVFLRLDRAANYQECIEALKNYFSPSQNFICADKSGKMGIVHTGKISIKRPGQGMFVMRAPNFPKIGESFVPFADLPKSENPKSGFVFSANQNPLSREYPYFMGTEYYSNYRARKINQALSQQKKVSPIEMMNLQNDVTSVLAQELRNKMVSLIGNAKPQFHLALKVVRDWDFAYHAHSIGASIFWTWFKTFEENVWKNKLGDKKNYEWPEAETLAYLVLHNTKSSWFSSLEKQMTDSFEEACLNLIKKHGDDIQNWKWGRVRPTNFPHNAKIPGFSRDGLAVGGDEFTLFSNKGHHGPVYKAVIALGEKPEAWMLLPGGPSGNPFSQNYDSNLPDWSQGKFRSVKYFLSEGEIPNKKTLKISPVERK